MKRLLALFAVAALLASTAAQAHTIGGAYAMLVDCSWGTYGYQHGYIGTYRVNGQLISQFFGSTHCPY
jgi:hypothetical protein